MTRGRAEDSHRRVVDLIVSSMLLVLQSKRILLVSARVKFVRFGTEQNVIDVERLEGEVRRAHERYNNAVLQWGSSGSPQYQLVAYSTLIAKGERLLTSLRRATDQLPPQERGDVVAEIRDLEKIVAGWRSMARASMSAVA